MSSTRATQNFTIDGYTFEVGVEQTSNNYMSCTFMGLEEASTFVAWAGKLGFHLEHVLSQTMDSILNSGAELTSIKLSVSNKIYSSLAFYNEYKENNAPEEKTTAAPVAATTDAELDLAIALSLQTTDVKATEQKDYEIALQLSQEQKDEEANRRAAIAADQYWNQMEEMEAAAEAELRAAEIPARLALAREQSKREEEQRELVKNIQTQIKNLVYYRKKDETPVTETVSKINELEVKNADQTPTKPGFFSKRQTTELVEDLTIYNPVFNFYSNNDL